LIPQGFHLIAPGSRWKAAGFDLTGPGSRWKAGGFASTGPGMQSFAPGLPMRGRIGDVSGRAAFGHRPGAAGQAGLACAAPPNAHGTGRDCDGSHPAAARARQSVLLLCPPSSALRLWGSLPAASRSMAVLLHAPGCTSCWGHGLTTADSWKKRMGSAAAQINPVQRRGAIRCFHESAVVFAPDVK